MALTGGLQWLGMRARSAPDDCREATWLGRNECMRNLSVLWTCLSMTTDEKGPNKRINNAKTWVRQLPAASGTDGVIHDLLAASVTLLPLPRPLQWQPQRQRSNGYLCTEERVATVYNLRTHSTSASQSPIIRPDKAPPVLSIRSAADPFT